MLKQSSPEGLQLWRGPLLKQCVFCRRNPHWSEEEREKEGAAEIKHWDLTTMPFPCSPALLEESEVEPGKNRGVGEVFLFLPLLPCYNQFSINELPQAE